MNPLILAALPPFFIKWDDADDLEVTLFLRFFIMIAALAAVGVRFCFLLGLRYAAPVALLLLFKKAALFAETAVGAAITGAVALVCLTWFGTAVVVLVNCRMGSWLVSPLILIEETDVGAVVVAGAGVRTRPAGAKDMGLTDGFCGAGAGLVVAKVFCCC